MYHGADFTIVLNDGKFTLVDLKSYSTERFLVMQGGHDTEVSNF